MSIFDFKNLNPKHCHLSETTIDIWFIALNAATRIPPGILSPDEVKRGKRFYFEKHQRRFTHARYALRAIISRYLACEPKNIEFYYNKQGKPSIHHASDLQFNVSHTGEWAIIAIGKKHPLGIDLESYSPRPYQGIAEHLFSTEEHMALACASEHIKPWLFFNLWAQKEAFIKACGLGLSYPTKDFTVNLKGHGDFGVIDNLHQTVWRMKTFMPRIALSAALCHHPAISQINYYEPDDITSL